MRWLVADTLYRPEQMFCSHLDSYCHYLSEADELTWPVNMSESPAGSWTEWLPDVVFALDRFDVCARVSARLHVAQVAAVCSPMPWDVRRADGAPAYNLVLSSIPAMVDRARAAGCRAEYMPLAFDTRARVCGMGVERDLGCIFIGTVGPNHRRRAQYLEELRDVVQVLPPVFGREYFRTLARARVVFNVHAEWAEGAANNMRMYEAPGMGAAVVVDDAVYRLPAEMRQHISRLLETPTSFMNKAAWQRDEVLSRGCYEHRIPRLLELVRSL